jgi:hypothetical protein
MGDNVVIPERAFRHAALGRHQQFVFPVGEVNQGDATCLATLRPSGSHDAYGGAAAREGIHQAALTGAKHGHIQLCHPAHHVFDGAHMLFGQRLHFVPFLGNVIVLNHVSTPLDMNRKNCGIY